MQALILPHARDDVEVDDNTTSDIKILPGATANYDSGKQAMISTPADLYPEASCRYVDPLTVEDGVPRHRLLRYERPAQ